MLACSIFGAPKLSTCDINIFRVSAHQTFRASRDLSAGDKKLGGQPKRMRSFAPQRGRINTSGLYKYSFCSIFDFCNCYTHLHHSKFKTLENIFRNASQILQIVKQTSAFPLKLIELLFFFRTDFDEQCYIDRKFFRNSRNNYLSKFEISYSVENIKLCCK